ncbi:hypothetical protein Esi_0177_0036 [Ectocarpus siliculosus]|uniref:Uncharacterized protein n=1 Tax=Ectocarpus siliculosus TaxID=2880 RepID=D7FN90_ECTSI|nr:hypothetical protein Esi_0177_0036 [Ectocarpus siliculosus]|eukprot:CBJ30147.1 hypothetical protein Esi_0177_0036 [Ectocarpus siliculosus]
MASPSSSSPATVEETLASLKRRVFGGSEEDRELSCGLFGEEFEMKNAEIEDREYDFVFRHGTILVRVEEGVGGEVVPMVFSLCEYATDHFGDLTGLPLQWLFHEDATNKKTAAKIMMHIERSDSDSMCCYVNLKSKVRRWTSSFVSIRSLSNRPERAHEQRVGHEHLPPWYVLLKVCLPSALGLIKEPELLQQLYSKKAAEASKRAAPQKGRGKVGAKKTNKKAKGAPVAGDIQSREGVSSEACT